MEEEFDIDKWRAEKPMDYILAMNLINQSSNKNEVFRMIYNVTRLHIPYILFKYFSLTENASLNNSKFETLRKQKVYMSDVKDLNDPFDSKAYFYRPEQLKKYDRLSAHDGKLIDDFSAYPKIASFTANSVNSMPMWAHYSNNHQGFCVAYDMKDRRNVQLSGCTFPVQYTSKRIDVTDLMDFQVRKIVDGIEKHIAEGKKEILYDDLSIIFMISFFSNIKHETWSYEKEFRCVTGATAEGMPFITAIPKEVYIGKNCSQAHVDKLINIAKELQIPAFKMTFDEYSTDYNLTLELLI
jgi:hypothetical protein